LTLIRQKKIEKNLFSHPRQREKKKEKKSKTRWVDNIKNHAGGIFWKVKNRKIWKNLGETFIEI
jgi:hypothetical protein